MDLLPIYQKNPDADFSPTVDHAEVFKFVADLKAESRWIYSFTRTEDIITAALNPALVQIPPTFGPPGVSGNPIEIRSACQRIALLIDAAVDWETELRFIHVSEKFSPLFESLQGSTVEIIDELANVAPGIREGVQKAQSGPGPHTILVQLTLKSPQTLERFNKELKKLKGGLFSW